MTTNRPPDYFKTLSKDKTVNRNAAGAVAPGKTFRLQPERQAYPFFASNLLYAKGWLARSVTCMME